MYQPKHHLSELAGHDDLYTDREHEHLIWTHTQLHRAAVRLAQAWIAQGVRRGSTIVTWLANRVESLVFTYANIICGSTFVPLDFEMLNGARSVELTNLIDRLKPDVVVVAGKKDAATVEIAYDQVGPCYPRIRIALDEPHHSGKGDWLSLLDLISSTGKVLGEQEILEDASKPDPDRIDFIAFTSGTSSGKPKGCPKHVGGDTFSLAVFPQAFTFDRTSRWLLMQANFRILWRMSLAVLSVGGAVVMPAPTFSPKAVLDACAEYDITHIVLIPAQLHTLVDDNSFSPERVGSIKHAGFGGDVVTKDLLRKAQKNMPNARIVNGHGMSEGSSCIIWPYFETDIESIPDFGGIVPLGRVGRGVAIRIFDVENNRVAKRGELHEFQLSSPATIKGYLDGVGKDSFVTDATGPTGRWFKTGDVGFMDKDGLVYLMGRMDDRIKRIGIRITPAALEASIREYVGSNVAVFGVPNPKLGHEPFAVLESFKDKSREQVEKHVLDVFGKDSPLAVACTLQELGFDDWPLNATGKIMKITLCDAATKYLGR